MFRLYRLPDVAMRNILRQLDLFSLIHISTLSRKSLRILKSANVTLPSIEFNGDKYHPNTNLLTIKDHIGRAVSFKRIYSRESRNLSRIKIRKLSCFLIIPGIREVPMVKRYGILRMEPWKLKEISTFFLETFRIQNPSLALKVGNPMDHYSWDLIQHFNTVRIDEFNAVTLAEKDIKHILDVITVDTLILGMGASEGVSYSSPLKIQNLHLQKTIGLEFDAILTSASTFICLENHPHPTSSLLNQFIKKWIDKGLENLVSFSTRESGGRWFKVDFDLTDEYVAEVMEGVEYTKIDVSRQPEESLMFRIFPSHTATLKQRWDIQRSDGKKASIGIFSRMFRFHVWDEQVEEQRN